MKNRWLAIACTLPLTVACSGENSTINLSSNTVAQPQLDTIIANINRLYPDATQEQKQSAAQVVVHAIENMVWVKGGRFDMGDFKMDCDFPTKTENRMDWSPDAQCLSHFASDLFGARYLHQVTLDSYSIAKYETSFMDMEWMRQINKLPVALTNLISIIPMKTKPMLRSDKQYKLTIDYNLKHSEAASTKAWQEAKDYCQWLGKVSGLPFDLPTEAQWEYAARSRGQHYYYATNNGYLSYAESQYYNPALGKYIEVPESEVNSSIDLEKYIGYWPANPLGIYGMSNNISEWINDWYKKDYYLESPAVNPQGPKSGTQKVMRDGASNVMTFGRSGEDIKQDSYYLKHSFRCAVQQTQSLGD